MPAEDVLKELEELAMADKTIQLAMFQYFYGRDIYAGQKVKPARKMFMNDLANPEKRKVLCEQFLPEYRGILDDDGKDQGLLRFIREIKACNSSNNCLEGKIGGASSFVKKAALVALFSLAAFTVYDSFVEHNHPDYVEYFLLGSFFASVTSALFSYGSNAYK